MIRFKIYKCFAALNSAPILSSLERSITRSGNLLVENDEDVAVIWSVLWTGRMQGNQQIYEHRKKTGKITMIVEVGNLIRNTTWRISLDHVNNLGFFGDLSDIDTKRPEKFKITLKSEKKSSNPSILIACQHEKSLQWQGLSPMPVWIEQTVKNIRSYSERPIIIRNHPRSRFSQTLKNINVQYQNPRPIPKSYDDFDIDYDYHCVINHNSGPGIQSAIHGTPIICDQTSLAFPVSDSISNIETPCLKDRNQWLIEISHTEWFLDEIDKGIPLSRLLPEIKKRLNR